MPSGTSYFELSVHCQDARGQVFYRLYTYLEDWERRVWREQAAGKVKEMARITGLLDVLRSKNIIPLEEPASGQIVEGRAMGRWIQGAEKVLNHGRSVWLIRDA